MRVVFMGSAELSCSSLEALLEEPGIDVVLAVTQPDRPKGRSLRVSACPSKKFAEERGLRVIAPSDLYSEAVLQELRDANADYFVVVAYGRILKPVLLEMPAKGCINLHTSLLPKYRGAAPIQWAIASGDSVTGVTTMHLNEGMDTGDIIYSEEEPIHDDDTGGTVHDRLAGRGAHLLVRTLKDLERGTALRVPQDSCKATYAPKLSKSDGRIDWCQDAKVLYNRIRAFNPWPVVWCRSGSAVAKRENCAIRIYRAECVEGHGQPGCVLSAGDEGIDVAAGSAVIRITELQPEGGRRMEVAEFLRGHYVEPGKFLE